jgi:hypothetical protein
MTLNTLHIVIEIWAAVSVAVAIVSLIWVLRYWQDSFRREFFRERVNIIGASESNEDLQNDFHSVIRTEARSIMEDEEKVLLPLSHLVARYATAKRKTIPLIFDEARKLDSDKIQFMLHTFHSQFFESSERANRNFAELVNVLIKETSGPLDKVPLIRNFVLRVLTKATKMYLIEILIIMARGQTLGDKYANFPRSRRTISTGLSEKVGSP